MRFSLSRTAGVLAISCASVVAQAADLTSSDQKFSYAVGFQLANQLKSQGITVEPAAFAAAVGDVLGGKKLQLTLEEMQAALTEKRKALQKALQKEQVAKAKVAGDAAKKFLDENKGKPGVKTLDNGLQYKVEKEGDGASPTAEDKVTVNYRGTLINGTEFDSSYKRNEPVTFSLQGVIPGFREAITRMKPGAKWTIYVPPELGYGIAGAGNAIGPNEALIFDIELISVAKGDGAADAMK